MWGVVFIILYRFAEGQAIKIVPLFLKAAREQGGLGLATSEIGIVYGTFGAAAYVAGSILAGYFTAKRGLRKSLFILCCFFNIPFPAYAFLAIAMPTSLSVIGAAVVFEYFGYGFGFVGLTLFMMQQIAPGKYKMAHYAFATGIMNLGMMIPSMLSGFVSDWLGYRDFFLWVMLSQSGSIWSQQYYLTDVGIAAQSLMLAAHAQGLGSVFVGVFDEERLRSLLAIPPHIRVVGIFPVGYSAEQQKEAPARKPLHEFIFHGQCEVQA